MIITMKIEESIFYPSINPKNYNERTIVITVLVISIILSLAYYALQNYHCFGNRPIVKMSTEQQVKFKAAIHQLINPSTPDDESFWRSIDEEKKHLSKEIASIDKTFQHTKLQPLVSAAQKAPSQDRRYATDLLFVIVGIKPVLFLTQEEWNNTQDLCPFLVELCRAFPEIKIIDKSPTYYIVNESPMEIFAPKHYLKGCLQLSQEIVSHKSATFAEHNQRLAYLLGYGPTWESYQYHQEGCHQISASNTAQTTSEYGKKHFEQLGQVIKPYLGNENSFSEEELGRYYHHHFRSYYPITASMSDGRFSCVHTKTSLSKIKGPVHDNLSIKTAYFKQRLFLRKYVLLKLGFSEASSI